MSSRDRTASSIAMASCESTDIHVNETITHLFRQFSRTVTYTADPKEGFKAEVVREPTDIVVKVPTQAPPTQQSQHQQLFRQAAPAAKQQQQYVPSQQQYRAQQQDRPEYVPQQARPEYAQYQQ